MKSKAFKGAMNVTDFVLKLRTIRDLLTEGLVEREIAVRLSLLASLAGEHLLLLGPPGTAKSLVARRLHLAFENSAYFERLLTRFTVPEELFGPLSIKGLEEDRYERLTDAYLPKASIGFLDEIFKANSAILNALLTLLNEREFDNGSKREKTPLIAVIGASNELPQGEELDALFDRFLLRLHVGSVSKQSFPSLLGLSEQSPPDIPSELKLNRNEVETVQEVVKAVSLPDDVISLLCDLREWCIAEGIRVSDRRWRKIVKLLQTSAATNGRNRVSIWDCWLLQHCLGDTVEAREKVYSWFAERVGSSSVMDPSRLTTIVVSWEALLEKNKNSRSQLRNANGTPLFNGANGEYTVARSIRIQRERNGAPLFLAPSNATSGYYNESIRDRTNNGKGYTLQELDQLRIKATGNYTESFRSWNAQDAYLADMSNWFVHEVDSVPALEPTRQKESYIKTCIDELDNIKSEVEVYQNRLIDHINSLETEIREHLWVPQEFVEPAAHNLEQTRREVDILLDRVVRLRTGFEALPREVSSAEEINPSAVKVTDRRRFS